MKNQLKLIQGAWRWDRSWYWNFPEDWIVKVFTHGPLKALGEEEMIRKIKTPVGSDPLEGIVDPGKSVLIICDDLSRPTRSDQLLPLLTGLIAAQGVKKERIGILISSGTHAPMKPGEVELKLGSQIVEDHKVYIHDYRKKGVFMGKTTRGTPVYVNRQITKYDLILGLGGIYPHSTAGFSGGAKLILGVCSIRTILHFHLKREGAPTGGRTDNDFRLDVLDAARLSGMNFIISSMINKEREVTEVISGDVEKAFEHGVNIARKTYGVPKPDSEQFDLVIADTYPFDASYAFTRKGWWPIRNISQECHKLILSSMHEGKGGHLIYPIPFDRKINKIRRLYFELRAFGLIHFVTKTLVTRVQSKFPRVEMKNSPGIRNHPVNGHSSPIESAFPGRDVDILHQATGEARSSLENLPNRLFHNGDDYLRTLAESSGNKPLRVAFYQASSLTFPEPDSDELFHA